MESFKNTIRSLTWVAIIVPAASAQGPAITVWRVPSSDWYAVTEGPSNWPYALASALPSPLVVAGPVVSYSLPVTTWRPTYAPAPVIGPPAERVIVRRPVVERSEREETYTVRRPVVETSERVEEYTVRRPVEETSYREEEVKVEKPVRERVEMEEVTTHYDRVTTYRIDADGWSTPVTTYEPRVETRRVPVERVRYVQETEFRKVPVTTVRYVEEKRTRTVPERTVRYVEEQRVRRVPVETIRYVEEEAWRPAR